MTWIFESTLKLEQRCFSNHKLNAGHRNWPWPSNSSEWGTKHVFRVNLLQIRSARKNGGFSQMSRFQRHLPKTPIFSLWWPWPLTLIFKLIQARDQTRLPCEFGTNPVSSSRDISYTSKKSHSANQIQNLMQFTACDKKGKMENSNEPEPNSLESGVWW